MVFPNYIINHFDRHLFIVPMRTADNSGKKLAFKQVTEWPVSNIMQKS
ncbi:hypothetical protein MtrunA17_Chr6g0450861 [Medicago truncatula]|uniref:Uncharacterized protein n=1 Tax=Medicago truncatula TaxID=3880 RepID=A0A396H964_MEDTR|nr:hypothetical protein MtrunA17_Chr6g0450861 [Medicago truncatula]